MCLAAGRIKTRPRPEFLPIGTVTIWGLIIRGGGVASLAHGGFSSIPGPNPSMPGAPPSVTTTDVPRHHPMSWEGGRRRGRNQCLSCKLLKCGARPGREWQRQSPEPGPKGRQADGPPPPTPGFGALCPGAERPWGPRPAWECGGIQEARAQAGRGARGRRPPLRECWAARPIAQIGILSCRVE